MPENEFYHYERSPGQTCAAAEWENVLCRAESARKKAVHERLRKLGFDVYVIDNTARVKEILDEICTAQVSGNGD